MKNLKKVLALVTVLAMMISVVPVMAAEYSDVADTASYAEAVEILSALGIVTGYEDGTFQPDKTITRAEASTIITRMLGQEATAKAMAGNTIFTDVASNHWASGFINFGVQKQYINGRGDGTYDPESPVSYEEMVKVIVAALGYTIKAESNGGYPSGYLTIASQEGITKGTTATQGGASRATVARLVYNALTVETMDIVEYNSDGTAKWGKTGQYLLYDYLDVDKYEGVVTSTYLQSFTSIDDDKTITLDYEKVNGVENVDSDTFFVGDTNAAEYLGYNAVVYVQEDEETGDDTIVAIAPKGTKNATLTVAGSKFQKTGEPFTATTAWYWKNGKDVDSKPTKIQLVANPTIYVNGKLDNSFDVTTDLETVQGSVTFISNNGQDAYNYIIVTQYTAEFVVDDINETNYVIRGKGGKSLTMDPENEEVLYNIIKDGKPASFEDIELDDTITVVAADSDLESGVITVYVSTATVEGTISEVTPNGDIVIDGKTYTKSAKAVSSDLSLGASGIFYLNVDNQVVYSEAAVEVTGNYAYLVGVDAKAAFGTKSFSIKFINEKGETVKADVADKVKFGKEQAKNSKTLSKLTGIDAAEKSIFNVLFPGETVTLFKYDVDSTGAVNKLVIPGRDGDSRGHFTLDGGYEKNIKSYDAEDNSVGNVSFDDETIVFAVNTADAAKTKVTTVPSVFTDRELTAKFDAYDYNSAGVAAVAVVYDADAAINKDDHVVVVSQVNAKVLDADKDETGYMVYGYQNGSKVELMISDEEPVEYRVNGAAIDATGKTPVDMLSKGAVIMVGKTGDYVTTIELKTSVKNNVATGSNPVPEDDDYTDNFVKVIGRNYSKNVYDVAPAVDGSTSIKLSKAGINFTEVNLTNSSSVTVKNSDVSVLGFDKYDYQLYIRRADGDIIDVVVYKYKKNEAPDVTDAPATEAPEATEAPATTDAPATTEAPATTDAPTVAPTVAPTDAPIQGEGERLELAAYTNAGSTKDGDVYTLDTSAADASLYFWADNIIAALAEGKTVVFNITGEIPTANADDCFFFGYMKRNDNSTHYELEDLGKGAIDTTITLTPDQVFEITNAEIWNFGVYSKNAAGHANTATLTITAETFGEDAPVVTEAPATDDPDATEAPATEEPTAAPIDPDALWNADFANAYAQAQDGIIENSAAQLYMKKSGTQTGFCSILWGEFDSADHAVPYTMNFTAKVAGGYGHSWDGYSISVRHTGGASDTELIRLVPTATGVDITIGAGNATLASVTGKDFHDYSVTFDAANGTIEIAVDGEVVVAETDWTAPASYDGIMIKSGHAEATGCELWMTSMNIVEA